MLFALLLQEDYSYMLLHQYVLLQFKADPDSGQAFCSDSFMWDIWMCKESNIRL